MKILPVVPQTLYVEPKLSKSDSVVVASTALVAKLYKKQKVIAPSHTAVNSRELYEFLNGKGKYPEVNQGRCNWVAATLGNALGGNFTPSYLCSWEGSMYDGDAFFVFVTCIPFADPDLIPENCELPKVRTPVWFTVFKFNRRD